MPCVVASHAPPTVRCYQPVLSSLDVAETMFSLFLCRLVVSRPLNCGMQSNMSPAVVVDRGVAGPEAG
jgi:hypothetical protein